MNHQHKKNFTKQQFDIKPAGKPETASWENFISLLEKYFFSVEKLFFSSWALFRSPFWRIFGRFWPLMVIISEYQKVLRFHFCFDKRKILSSEQWAMRGVGTLRAASEDFSLTQISPIPQMLLLFREIRERNNAYTPTKLIAKHKTRNKSVKKREKGICTECGKILKYISN